MGTAQRMMKTDIPKPETQILMRLPMEISLPSHTTRLNRSTKDDIQSTVDEVHHEQRSELETVLYSGLLICNRIVT